MKYIKECYDVIPSPKRFSNKNGMIETYGKEWEYIKNKNPRNVWTLIDDENGLYAVPGLHICNKIAYIITKQKWKSLEEIYIWDEWCGEIEFNGIVLPAEHNIKKVRI